MTWQWLVAYIWFDPVVGSERGGNRPALIVSGEAFNQSVDVLTVLPITTRRADRRIYPNEVLLSAGEAGLSAESIVLAHQIRTVSKSRVKRTIGYLTDPERRRAVHDALSLHLELYWSE